MCDLARVRFFLCAALESSPPAASSAPSSAPLSSMPPALDDVRASPSAAAAAAGTTTAAAISEVPASGTAAAASTAAVDDDSAVVAAASTSSALTCTPLLVPERLPLKSEPMRFLSDGVVAPSPLSPVLPGRSSLSVGTCGRCSSGELFWRTASAGECEPLSCNSGSLVSDSVISGGRLSSDSVLMLSRRGTAPTPIGDDDAVPRCCSLACACCACACCAAVCDC
jgi:hypothetical protein